jgi:cytochrome c oxidase cbb3-type subunit 1
MGIAWLSYGRLRPLHTNAVIFAFGGCGLFATSLLRGATHMPCAACLVTNWPRSHSGVGNW